MADWLSARQHLALLRLVCYLHVRLRPNFRLHVLLSTMALDAPLMRVRCHRCWQASHQPSRPFRPGGFRLAASQAGILFMAGGKQRSRIACSRSSEGESSSLEGVLVPLITAQASAAHSPWLRYSVRTCAAAEAERLRLVHVVYNAGPDGCVRSSRIPQARSSPPQLRCRFCRSEAQLRSSTGVVLRKRSALE